MLKKSPGCVFFPFLAVFSVNCSAEQNVGELVKELTLQIKELKNQVAQSNARIDELEQQLKRSDNNQAVAKPSNNLQTAKPLVSKAESSEKGNEISNNKRVVRAGDIAGTFNVPGTDTSIGIGGFVKLDTLFSSTNTGKDNYGNQRLELADIPVDSVQSGDNDQITLHAKESRFWFKSYTPSRWADINTYLELDFYGDPGLYNYTPRVRHAYGTFGNLLAGQTWTTFLNSRALADTLDYNNTGTILVLRQPQLRWTQAFEFAGMPMVWQVALEASRSRIWNVANSGMSTFNSSHYPDLIARLNYLPSWGNLSLAVMGRQVQYTPAAIDQEKSIWGGAVNLSGKINTYDADNIRFMLAYGTMGRYGTNNFFADAVVDSQGNMELLPVYAGFLAYQHWWDREWRSTLAYGITYADQPTYVPTANQRAQAIHANLLWSPINQATVGLEYIYGTREQVNGQNGELNRLQFSTRFNF